MMICPLCGHVGHVRSSFRIPRTNVVERYMVCTNINCGHTFITHESFTRSIVRPGTIDPVTPHPGTGKPQLDLLAGLQAEEQPDANNNHP
ncbi:ogr/Delta-like zinc finger family protein [Salmonella enterica]|uniref:Late control protein B n=3 Tax=Salmonella enterica TaxID=28901 RepID=A0A636GDM7_SALET|nr:late control protein B [Salmonella enterica subsp. enterica serovar Rubislaw]EAP3755834.1 late control protein B [Salmonella enterica]EAU5215742.1 late control protein B [Salmonella enterica subsp. enterica serovar Oranienburg]EBK2763456.1 late control protein B [Salmonella enterica subsp. enterica serovar Muenchen]EBM9947289.1 late control protein B [Salmonella enterica subsp. enterica serovar Give]EBP3855884.1 late control protein B [Salmonella enterica subsp. enterica]EBR9318833.1 late 